MKDFTRIVLGQWGLRLNQKSLSKLMPCHGILRYGEERLFHLIVACHTGEVTVLSNPHTVVKVCGMCGFCPTARSASLLQEETGLPNIYFSTELSQHLK
jgi:hypothetical protein